MVLLITDNAKPQKINGNHKPPVNFKEIETVSTNIDTDYLRHLIFTTFVNLT